MAKNIPQVRSYSQCIELIQEKLREMAKTHGALKQWCATHDLSYSPVVNIKNGKMKDYLPQLVLKILVGLGYEASITRKIHSNQQEEDIYIIIENDKSRSASNT